MSNCPPGSVRNPRTLRCISAIGRIAQELVRAGDLRESATATAAAVPMKQQQQQTQVRPCPPTSVRNPASGRCITVGGRAYTQLGFSVAATAAVAPDTMDRAALTRWAATECPTNPSFVNAETSALRQLIRLHDRTCMFAPQLNSHIASEHQAGRIADTMTLDDFKVLRNAMRRTDPAYKLPDRRHQPPPTSWQLYIARDERSGPDFVSVLYVDVNRGYRTETGMIVYPSTAIRVDLGFLPIDIPAEARCDITVLVNVIRLLAESNRLLVHVGGGWKPIAGLPHTKAHWTTDRVTKVNRLCRDLMRPLRRV
jgi:hypothetical protein